MLHIFFQYSLYTSGNVRWNFTKTAHLLIFLKLNMSFVLCFSHIFTSGIISVATDVRSK